MALLQISEPDASPDPHERRLAVGIDLGTTHSLVAAVRSGVAECLPDEQGRVLLPSVVRYLADNRREIGQAALDNQATDAANTISSVKRFMGRSLADIAGREQLPYQFNEASSSVQLHTRAGVMSPVQISGDILATLRYRAEDTLGDDLVGAVITVPAYFDDAQRQATKDAAHLAGINVLRLINEPTAAAIAYGLDNAAEGTYAVYDLGGGTFDISILKLTKGVFEVIATGGDSALGGDDYDVCLVNEVLKRQAIDAASLSADDKAAIKIAARAAKEQLSTQDIATFTVALKAYGEITTAFLISEFEQLTAHLTANSLRAVKKALRDAKLTPPDIKGVVLVGGSTRMPAVQRAVAGFFGQTPLTNLNPDEVVALGAAIQANQLAGNRSANNLLLLDVVPLSLGLETMGGLSEKIIARNTTIPTAKAQDFTTFKDGQTALALHVVQGERETVADCRSLARFELRGIPPMVAGAARIRVTFQVDADGLLSVTAREQLSGVEVQVAVKPSYGLEDGDITRMLQDSFAHAAGDKDARALAEEQVDAQRLLESVRAAMAQDHTLLSAAEQQRIHDAMAHVSVMLQATEHQAIHAATQALSKATDDFAALRMDRSVHDALAGKRVEEL